LPDRSKPDARAAGAAEVQAEPFVHHRSHDRAKRALKE
jgi:hypothetical protein